MRQGLRAVVCVAALLLTPSWASAAEPDGAPLEGPTEAPASDELVEVGERLFELEQPVMQAYVPGPAAFIAPVPIYAKRSSERSFDTTYGERDPRLRQRPRTHRFRLAIHAQWVKLPRSLNESTGASERFHYAPIMLDLAYQAQFLKYVMVRLAVAVGGNVANSRHAMPIVVVPQAYLGYQGKIIGVAFGYGFDWTIPPNFQASDPNKANALLEPVITRNNVVMGELSATSKIDRVAMTFALSLGGMQSDLSQFGAYQGRKWRFYLGLQAGVYFDGTIRREKKARKKAEAEGR